MKRFSCLIGERGIILLLYRSVLSLWWHGKYEIVYAMRRITNMLNRMLRDKTSDLQAMSAHMATQPAISALSLPLCDWCSRD